MDSFVPAFTTLFVVVEPLSVVPTFAALTARSSEREAARVALRASLVGAVVLAGFALLGERVLQVLGVSLPAFRMAGGVLLLLTALDMLRGRAGGDALEGDVAVAPLAVPLLAGPGAMATTMMLVGDGGPARHGAVLAAIALTFGVSFVLLRGARWVNAVLPPAMVLVVQKVLGLLLAAMALQAVLEGGRRVLFPEAL